MGTVVHGEEGGESFFLDYEGDLCSCYGGPLYEVLGDVRQGVWCVDGEPDPGVYRVVDDAVGEVKEAFYFLLEFEGYFGAYGEGLVYEVSDVVGSWCGCGPGGPAEGVPGFPVCGCEEVFSSLLGYEVELFSCGEEPEQGMLEGVRWGVGCGTGDPEAYVYRGLGVVVN